MPDLVSDAVDAYARVHTTPQSDLRAELAAVTHEKTDAPNMLIGPVEAQLLQTFVRLLQARCILELGCFTGYSALSMADFSPVSACLTRTISGPEPACRFNSRKASISCRCRSGAVAVRTACHA